jgi:hypothetical protein
VIGRRADHIAVVPGVADEKDEPTRLGISSLQRDPTQQRLDVTEPGLGFHVDRQPGDDVGAHRVPGTSVSRDRQRHLGLP